MFASTENHEVLLLLARRTAVWARDTDTTTPPLDEERHGRDTTPSACGDTDRLADDDPQLQRNLETRDITCCPDELSSDCRYRIKGCMDEVKLAYDMVLRSSTPVIKTWRRFMVAIML